MKHIVVLLSIVTMVIGVAAAAHEGEEHAKKGTQPVTLTGEVIDLTCFMQHPESATGAEHAKCAKSCIAKGLPVGFLANNGKVYTLIGTDHEPVAAMVAASLGTKSTITGTVIEHHGVKAIELASIGAAPAPKLKATPAAMYTCSMDPDVRQAQPGNCPKCGMALVLEKKK